MSVKRISLALVALIIVVGFGSVGARDIANKRDKLEVQTVKIKDLKTELQEVNIKYDDITNKLEESAKQKEADKAEIQKKEQEKLELEKQKKDLEAQLQAKLEEKKRLAEASSKAVDKATGTKVAYAGAINTAAGGCEAWFAQAGISGSDLGYARELLRRENAGCDPQKYNMGGSNACGVAQELPCGKSGCGLPPNANGACQIAWQKSYVIARYGSYAGAIEHHNRKGWY